MELTLYVNNAIRTESLIDSVKYDPIILTRVCSAFVAAGNLLDMIKKNVFYGKPINVEKWDQQCELLKQAGNRLANGEYLKLQDMDTVIPVDPRIFHAVVGVATEATELVQALPIFQQTTIDTVNLCEEVGDLCWYLAILVDAIQADWSKVLDANIAKLQLRYPEKFDSVKAIERNLGAERDILERQASPTCAPALNSNANCPWKEQV